MLKNYLRIALRSLAKHKGFSLLNIFGLAVGMTVFLLSKDMLKLVAISIVLAAPLAWWGMENWLQDFAFRTQIEWWIFAMAGAVAAGVAFLTIGFQGIKAALVNPVESLRME